MPVPILPCPPDTPDHGVIERAGRTLRDGGLVAIPTETVYGLAANALDPVAVAAIFTAKGRPASDPLIVHVDGPAMADAVVEGTLPKTAATLAAAFWPGPLTLVLPRNDAVPAAVSSGLDTVGVRCPAHPVALAIIAAAGVPLAAPSANRFGRVSPTSALHVAEELGDRLDLIIDGGRCDAGVESTVVAIDDDTAVVLRHGAIPIEALAQHVPVRAVDARTEAARASPGHDQRHYSPGAATTAVVPGFVPTADDGGDVLYLGYTDAVPVLPPGWRFVALGSRADLEGVARRLYDTLRAADAEQPARIVVELSGAAGIGRAIDDRLTRAGSSRVVASGDSPI